MTKLKLIGCVMLLGMTCYGCGQKDEIEETGVDGIVQVETSKSSSENQGQSVENQSGESTEDQAENMPGHELENPSGNQSKVPAQGETGPENFPWEMVPGLQTMENLLVTALAPVGQTMYIWGGGWNEEDTGAGPEATSLGVSPGWALFAAQQTAEYDYYDFKYQIHDGLDCSGYIGWLVYNLFETENDQEGYVMKSSLMAEKFADRGWGTFTPPEHVTDWQLGDIMSMKGHVWLCLGMCEDGSVLILHSSVTGVSVCGTLLPDGSESQAVLLATDFMSTCYPEWYERYPRCSRSFDYLTESGQFRWDEEILKDEMNLKDYSAEELLALLEKKLLAN